MNDHMKSEYHLECIKAEKKLFNKPDEEKQFMDFHISNTNKELANHIGKLMLQVYVDAKKLSLSAYSWPSRFVSSEAGHSFDFNSNSASTVPTNINLQYVTPSSHCDLLGTIVHSYSEEIKIKLNNAVASSIRIDGSVDRNQIDKVYILLKILTKEGEAELIFLGIGEHTIRGAKGLLDAVKNGIINNFGEEQYKDILCKISSICTDGTNANIGEKNGLWKLFEDEMLKEGSIIALIKIWCSAHRAELVWHDLTSSNKAVGKMLSILSSISSYFHNSALRGSELKAIAGDNDLKILTLPKIFEIRWSEFTFVLIKNIITSWNALMIYFATKKKIVNGKETDEPDPQCVGFKNFLNRLDNLKLIMFIADVLYIFQKFHKKTQRNDLTIISLIKAIGTIKRELSDLKSTPLLDGIEEQFSSTLVKKGDKMFLKDIEILQKKVTRTTTNANFEAEFQIQRSKIIDSLLESFKDRFEVEEGFNKTIEPFVKLEKSADIKKVHSLFGADLSLPALALQYRELIEEYAGELMPSSTSLAEIVRKIAISPSLKDNFNEIFIVLSRILICTPHSADVERSISANNILKTPLRSNLHILTENYYLFVNFNMPPAELWNPRKAITVWINSKNRRKHDLVPKGKAQKQRYYKGVFRDVDDKKSEDDAELCALRKIKF